ncbi:hypothetical protein ACFSTH_01680 [Paenibacillus yanchengensis]|uniref:Uncharacterized protein n=1 Tax=Paenibacillus yanchengensis TaxID=2035833 RepID=A0ABW4YR40_9BACL
MDKKRKVAIISTIVLLGALTVSISIYANDFLVSKTSEKPNAVTAIDQQHSEVLAQVGDVAITKHDVLKFKAYQQLQIASQASNSDVNESLSEEFLLEYLIKEELFLQLATERSVDATIEEGIKLAAENKQILQSQPQQIMDIHNKLIEAMEVTEEQYWNEIAPSEYRKIISIQNLTQLLVEDGTIQYDWQNSDSLGGALNDFKNSLYEKYQSH